MPIDEIVLAAGVADAHMSPDDAGRGNILARLPPDRSDDGTPATGTLDRPSDPRAGSASAEARRRTTFPAMGFWRARSIILRDASMPITSAWKCVANS
jgi:hypothetical protein